MAERKALFPSPSCSHRKSFFFQPLSLAGRGIMAAKVGIFSQHLWILVSFVLRIQTRSIRLCEARIDSCILCFTHSNKKYKVGIFSQHLWILVSFVLRIQTRDTKIMASREVCEPFIPCAARDNGCASCSRLLVRIENLFSFSHYPS